MLTTAVETESPSDRPHLLELVHGYRSTCLIVTALRLGLVDELGDAPMRESQLALALGAHLPSLVRLLRGLASIGLVEHAADGVRLTAMGRLLRAGDTGIRERAILAGEEYLPAWQALRHSVLTGKPAFDHVFGMSAWEHRRRNPELNRCVNQNMADDQRRAGRAVPAAYDFSRCRRIVDVGGGEGMLIAEILTAFAAPSAIVFDQPHVAAGAERVLAAAGVRGRCEIVGGSFFDAVPRGGDTYLLQHILHDWNDERCATILANCRAAMDAGGVLLVIENIMPDDAKPDARLVMLDLHMLTMLGGSERTRGEYAALLRSSGFEFARATRTRTGSEIIVATAA